MSNVPNFAPVVLAAAGAVTAIAPYATYAITAAGAIALTLAAPAEDGIELTFCDEGGHAHTLVCTGAGSPPTAGLNGGTTNNKLTWNGTIGSAATIYSRNGFWWTLPLSGVTVS
jgi:hypothetical protein